MRADRFGAYIAVISATPLLTNRKTVREQHGKRLLRVHPPPRVPLPQHRIARSPTKRYPQHQSCLNRRIAQDISVLRLTPSDTGQELPGDPVDIGVPLLIPSDRKWYRNLVISQLLIDKLESLDMSCPEPAIGIESIIIDD